MTQIIQVGDRVELKAYHNVKTQREPDREPRAVKPGETGVVRRHAGTLVYLEMDADSAIVVSAPSLVRLVS